MRNVLTLVLGGGRGTRLYPLTKLRSKPAVPLAGKYRLIDIPLSNCINSGLNRIYVLTQFNSVSLHRHIRQTYVFDHFAGGYVELLAAQQTDESSDWYQGTADAVRQNLRYLKQPGIDSVLILSGDQLYRMDYRELFETHHRTGADVTITAQPRHRRDAHALGVMRLDDSGRVRGFVEKPKTDDLIDSVRTDPAWIDAHGIESRGRELLGNMGIYLFKRDVLVDLLTETDAPDFGNQIFPKSIGTHHVQVHLYDDYWEDIGTIRNFYEANLDLAKPNPAFELTSAVAPIYSRPRFLPPAKVEGAHVTRSLLADGCVIGEGATIENSVIGLRCRVGRNVVIRNSVIMGNDFFETPKQLADDTLRGRPPIGIGDGSIIEGAIVDKNCHIGRNVTIRYEGSDDTLTEDRGGDAMICDGIAVISKGAVLPDGWTMPRGK